MKLRVIGVSLGIAMFPWLAVVARAQNIAVDAAPSPRSEFVQSIPVAWRRD